MTFKVCANLLAVALAFVLTSLSSRISEEIQKGEMLTTAVRLLHLFSFGTWMGMQFWVTFIAGEYVMIYLRCKIEIFYSASFETSFCA